MEKAYNVEVLGDSQSKFELMATPEDMEAFNRIICKLNDKVNTGELYLHDMICISVIDKETGDKVVQ